MLAIRFIYKTGAGKKIFKSGMGRNILNKMSTTQGKRYDSPGSVREIPKFIKYHNLNMDEVLLDPKEFNSFNEFFYRQLKPGARPVDEDEVYIIYNLILVEYFVSSGL